MQARLGPSIRGSRLLAAIVGGNTPFVPAGGASAVAVASTNVITEEALATITLPALNANAVVRVRFQVSCINNVNVKTVRARFSGAAGSILVAVPVTSMAGGGFAFTLQNRGATNSQFVDASAGLFHALGGTGAGQAFAVDTSVSTSLVITSQKATGTDALALESYLVEVLKP